MDIMAVDRNHRIPRLERPENVVEHSFSVAMLSWRLFDIVKPPLDLAKILTYALVHDFAERGQAVDVNTYASAEQRQAKKIAEAAEIAKITRQFPDFEDFTAALAAYEAGTDQEALFVWTADKLQAVILGGVIDGWWPYQRVGITYREFSAKMKEFIEKSSPYLRNIFIEIVRENEKTYYDQPSAG